jgi:large-conductance mechanosensitive channel
MTIFNNTIKYFNNILNEFFKFIIENNLLSLLIVGIIGLAVSTLITSLKTNIIDYYLNKFFKTTNNNIIKFVTSFIQFILIILFLFFIYNVFIKKMIHKYTINKFDDVAWKNNLLNEIRDINSKLK